MHLLLDTHLLVRAMGSPERLPAVLRRALLEGGWRELAIEARHALAVAQLPPLHRVPSTDCCWPRPRPTGCC